MVYHDLQVMFLHRKLIRRYRHIQKLYFSMFRAYNSLSMDIFVLIRNEHPSESDI